MQEPATDVFRRKPHEAALQCGHIAQADAPQAELALIMGGHDFPLRYLYQARRKTVAARRRQYRVLQQGGEVDGRDR